MGVDDLLVDAEYKKLGKEDNFHDVNDSTATKAKLQSLRPHLYYDKQEGKHKWSTTKGADHVDLLRKFGKLPINAGTFWIR